MKRKNNEIFQQQLVNKQHKRLLMINKKNR